ncbi:leucyl aminopeptidase [Roseiconus nitratireducens]|uniref:Probable cytosol aminopeptidase n=1 Tax=Roseiconus nitratireducens TaxID=2605748 RepID=A0A5M6D5N9_9BACT|nr:leucyl aminopeptidase [Roseiconus nitratireducens]KAA5541089.1 leucyl aminopeptidase [Roseiconus nitratireducens]
MSESLTQSQPNPISLQLPQPNFVSVDNPSGEDCDVLVIGLCEDRKLSAVAKQVDQLLGGSLSRLIDRDKISGESGETLLIAGPGAAGQDSAASLVLLIGLGDRAKLARESAFNLSSTAIRALGGKPHRKVVVALAEAFPAACHDAIVAGLLFGLECQAIYRTKPAIEVPDTIALAGIESDHITRGQILGDSVNLARRLVNEPASVVYPESFAATAESLAEQIGLSCEVWDEHRLVEENCRAILAVGGGSERPPRLLILQHRGGAEGDPPLAIVGKGVTFDSGGLSIKPSDGMVDMKCDMGGAATVLGTMHALAKMGVKKNVIGLCGLAENMVSGSSYKLGDVIRTRSGKTIEILNTDAEGRVVLSDTLDVAIGFKPKAMVDLATLTGACMVALGQEVAGAMTNDQSVCDAVMLAAREEGEPVWQLPMYQLYDEKVQSKVAEIKNVGEGRWGGAITAAKFLENFVGDTPWVHLDIAGPAFTDAPKPHRDAGATGVMVRALVRWVESEVQA